MTTSHLLLNVFLCLNDNKWEENVNGNDNDND